MLDGPDVASALKSAHITHVVWIPDSDLGRWDEALSREPTLTLVRVCREAEAFAVAAGLWLGGKRPIVMLQCTGLFDAGDALRNVLHDMALPLPVFVGVRNLLAHRRGQTTDTCPKFTGPIVAAWGLPRFEIHEGQPKASLWAALKLYESSKQALVILYPE
jgi:sulfopyruvate decarboxylase TPP-binding subunit